MCHLCESKLTPTILGLSCTKIQALILHLRPADNISFSFVAGEILTLQKANDSVLYKTLASMREQMINK